MHRALRQLTILFVVSVLGLPAYYYWSLPTTFRVAVEPSETQQLRFTNTLDKALVDGKAPVRLTPVSVNGSMGASAALDAGTVELAIVRSDDLSSQSARAVAVLQRRAIVIIARSDRIGTFADLQGKRLVAVQADTDPNKPLIERLLAHFEVRSGGDALGAASIGDAERSLIEGSTDALILVAPPAGSGIRKLVANLVKAGVPLSFIDFPAPEAIAQRFPYLQTTTIPAGIFGGTPPLPPEAIEAVSITYELVASRNLSQRKVAALTKAVLDAQLDKYRGDGAPFFIEAPPVNQTRRYMPHDGTKSFLEDTTQTLLETYSDHIWLILFGLSIAGSSITGLLIWMGLRARPESDERIHDLPAIMKRVSAAQTIAELDAIQKDLDVIFESSVQDYASGALGADEDIDRPIWLGHVQNRLQRRREELGQVRTPATNPR